MADGLRILKKPSTYIHSCKYSHFERESMESTLLQALMILGPGNGNLARGRFSTNSVYKVQLCCLRVL
jgi:hypothetical protein